MAKFFLKKIDGVDDLVKVVNKPIWGKVPEFYRDVDWNIDNNWYRSNGADLLLSIDPFGDQSLLRKFMFDGTYVDKVSGTVTAVPGGTHNHFQKSGPFDTKCLTVEDGELNANLINCGLITRASINDSTIAAWVRIIDNDTLLGKRNGNYWINIFKMESSLVDAGQCGNRTPALFYNVNTGRFSNTAGDNITTGSSQYLETPLNNIAGEWVHVAQVVSKFTSKLYVNGILVNELLSTTGDFYLGDATLKLGDAVFGTNCSYKQVEVYRKGLSPTEVKSLYNQQLFNEVICDGSNPTYKPFTYLTEKEKLLRVVTDESGNIVKYELVKKPGYIASTDNVVKYENGQLLDRYGKNVLSGSLNRLMHFSSNISVSVGTNATWGTMLTADVDMNTDKYDYIFMLNTGLEVLNLTSTAVHGGADINISIGNLSIVTNGHRGYTSVGVASTVDIHSQVDVSSPLITQGYKGKFKVRCNMSRHLQDASGVVVRNYNNAGQYSGKQTSINLSTLTVYELNKASNDLV